ncbi:MAG TPA: bifunctional [glutamate--ammonia ligase]-adenylyl-L-tyrosine phosphorylase/[glutamate--ammonia-ligase] adenylyltransferase, partial [Burkholderiaceae bacterium]
MQRVRRRYGDKLRRLPPGLPDFASITALVASLEADGAPVMSALRIARHLVLERLAVLDIEQGADQAGITAAMTHLAEATLERAHAQALAEVDPRWGVPRNDAGEVVEFWIVGMGKLGARELNVSSDIDLIYVYEEDAQTDGEKPVSAQEYFGQVARRMYALIGDVTDDGFVFRVDLALRPNGNSGPPVVSLAMLEEYFLVQGREWERFAWLKSRVVAPRAAVTSGRALALRALVTPFVYRRYLDYGVFEGLRQLHHRIREEAQRRAAGRPERANDVKLSRGGIREIEFIVQLLLVVRGGQFPEIRTRSTLKALDKLAAAGLMKPETAAQFRDAYVFLRRVEHRIQFLDDQQTHLLPTADADLGWISASMGLSCGKDACELLDRLGQIREFVSIEFDTLLHDGRSPPPRTGGCRGKCGAPAAQLDSDSWLERLPPELGERVRRFADNPRVQNLREESRLRIAKLVQRAVEDIRCGHCTIEAAMRFVDWIEPLLRRESYLALLVERPNVQRRLLRLLGLARWPMRYLMRHPGVIDELADERTMIERFDPAALAAELNDRHEAWHRSGEADEGALLDTLRRAHHAEVFRTLVRDVEGRITVEAVADELSGLADTILAVSLRWAWGHLKQRHRDEPRFAVIAYGKLGGKELGYGSDLDLVFLYDEADEPDVYRAQEAYGAFVRKLITWWTLRTAAGELFDIDTALRPNGNSGLLVTSIDSFERYQRGRGSNTAWTWEHQAITRARFCAGDPVLGARFEQTRRAVIEAQRDPEAVRAEIAAMRQKVRDAHPQRDGRIDPKHCPGGLMDIEFAVQYLVLTQGGPHPGLRDNLGNIALLRRAEEAGLLDVGIGTAAADAYRELRRAQHRARLDEQPTL